MAELHMSNTKHLLMCWIRIANTSYSEVIQEHSSNTIKSTIIKYPFYTL